MSWDPAWDEIFVSRPWGRYPPEELIRFVARHFYSAVPRREVKVLEIGCGPGANLWYLAREGFSACGIDGSPTAIRLAGERLAAEGLIAELAVGELASLAERYQAATFDAVVEVVCLSCNRVTEVADILDQVQRVLKPGGRVFSMALAAGTWGDGLGEEVEPGTFIGIAEGPLVGAGLCHLFTFAEIEALFGGRFADLAVESSVRSHAGRAHETRLWVTEARKP